ncbi:hypothetical protein [Buchananella hordeovulneris]|uniref:hypothetical protein n=1 Tax=Buchananella hordeovulneris TaxID=52770 RepID=UPI000F5D5881|nr:hypothetical protein [Buchananella hordeovulneris]RRD45106.1 hypothetical protein EII13_02895 [Buchananella hordeovulneris]
MKNIRLTLRHLVALLGALAAVFALVAVLSLTVWKPVERINAALTGQRAPYVLTAPGVLSLYPGDVTITVKAAGADSPVVLALGRSADVKAWVGQAEHATVVGIVDWETLQVDKSAAAPPASGAPTAAATPSAEGSAAPEDANPAGSDLWIKEATGTGQATLQWSPARAEQVSILAATDGLQAAPQVTISWKAPPQRSFFTPALLLTALFAAAAAGVWYLESVENRERARRREVAAKRAARRAATSSMLATIDPHAVAPVSRREVVEPEEDTPALTGIAGVVSGLLARFTAPRAGQAEPTDPPATAVPSPDLSVAAAAAPTAAAVVDLPPPTAEPQPAAEATSAGDRKSLAARLARKVAAKAGVAAQESLGELADEQLAKLEDADGLTALGQSLPQAGESPLAAVTPDWAQARQELEAVAADESVGSLGEAAQALADGDVAGRLQEAAEGLAGRGLQGGAKAAGAFVLKKWRKVKPAPAQAALPEFTELADAPAPDGQPSTPPPAAEDFGPAPLQGLLQRMKERGLEVDLPQEEEQ